MIFSDGDFVPTMDPYRPSQIFPVKINQLNADVLIDWGSSINVISCIILNSVSPTAQVLPYQRNIYAFISATPLDIKPSIWLIVFTADHLILAKCNSDIALSVLRFGPPKIHQLSDEPQLKLLFHGYNDLFEEFRQLKDVKFKTHVDLLLHPLHRKLVISLFNGTVDAKLDNLLDYKVIKPVTPLPMKGKPICYNTPKIF